MVTITRKGFSDVITHLWGVTDVMDHPQCGFDVIPHQNHTEGGPWRQWRPRSGLWRQRSFPGGPDPLEMLGIVRSWVVSSCKLHEHECYTIAQGLFIHVSWVKCLSLTVLSNKYGCQVESLQLMLRSDPLHSLHYQCANSSIIVRLHDQGASIIYTLNHW